MTAASQKQCCFCGNTIVKEGPDPVVLMIDLGEPEEEGSQSLFCHYRCLKRVLDPSVPLYPLDSK
jgi:hypothetical protein